jgi:hypothetical protein
MINHTLEQYPQLNEQLTSFAKKIVSRPNLYLNKAKYDPSNKPAYNLYDPNLPILSDEFIKKHNINSTEHSDKVNNKRYSLEVAEIFKWIYDVSLPPFNVLKDLISTIETISGKKFQRVRGNFLYPPGGFMGWHTNSDVPGTRCYVVYNDKENEGYFKYLDRKTGPAPFITTSHDREGWNIRFFDITSSPRDYLWHCVYAGNSFRISYGFMLV